MTTCHKGGDGDGLVVRSLFIRVVDAWADGQQLGGKTRCCRHDNGDRLGRESNDGVFYRCSGVEDYELVRQGGLPAISSRVRRLTLFRANAKSGHTFRRCLGWPPEVSRFHFCFLSFVSFQV
jgi:hypothetical protein